MWEVDYKQSWLPKNWCFWTVVLEKTLESALYCKEIKPVNPKGNQPWIFIGRTDVEAETLILWPPDVKNWFIRKGSDTGNDWGQENGMTEDEMVGWHHRPTDYMDMSLSKLWEMVDREAWSTAVHGVTKIEYDSVTELKWPEALLASLKIRGKWLRWLYVLWSKKPIV